MAENKLLRVDIDQPKFDMDTYMGRVRHFFLLTNPFNLLATDERLQRARDVVTAYRSGTEVPYVNTIEDVWREKYLYDSAYHPETGEKMFFLGRMAAQVPSNSILTACMVIFYRTQIQMFFFQWLNQTFNALVNYTNRSGNTPIQKNALQQAYFSATFGALATTFALKHFTRSMSTIVRRLVPFLATSAANCVNIPLMRQNELKHGITLYDKTDCEVGTSRKAAVFAISQVAFSRIMMALPTMTLTPITIEYLLRKGLVEAKSKLNASIQVGLVASILTFSTPLGCAIFRPKQPIKVANLSTTERKLLRKRCPNLEQVYFYKGL